MNTKNKLIIFLRNLGHLIDFFCNNIILGFSFLYKIELYFFIQLEDSATVLGAFLFHQLFNLVRKANLNKLQRDSTSPFPFRITRCS